MLTHKDTKKLIDAFSLVFPTKEELKTQFDELRQDFSNLQTSVNAYAKQAKLYYEEMLALSERINRHERWIKRLAEKVGIRLES